MTDIRGDIQEYIVKEFNPTVPVEDDSLLIQQGIVDSLAILMLIGFIQERFGVSVNPEDVRLENFETVNAIQALVDSVGNSKPPQSGA